MKKILVRAHMSPFDNWNAATVLKRDGVGTNAGNLIFVNSIIRTLMTEDVQIDKLNSRRDLTPENLERINAEYSCLVIPLANAFRNTFQREMQALTHFIRKLKIPCVLVGVGVSWGLKTSVDKKNEFDNTAREFLKAILEKSALIGVRGEVTGNYLKRLGFREDQDYQVIGCPSMYWYGAHLPKIEKEELSPDTPVSISWKMDLPEAIHQFMRENIAGFSDLMYVPQVTDELRLMYYGTPFPKGKYKKIPETYPDRPDHPFYREGRARGFINPQSWFAYMKTREFAFGSRIHGNIVPILSGVPSYIIASDYRITELAEYHQIPHINYTDLKEGDDIFHLYDRADYGPLNAGHKECFSRYLCFLEKNGLDNIFRRDPSTDGNGCPYDRKMAELPLQPPLTPFFSESTEEQARRLMEIQRAYTDLQSRFDEVAFVETLLKLYHADKGVKWFLNKLKKK